MKFPIADYTFLGLLNNGIQDDAEGGSLAYLIALVDSEKNEVINLDKAKYVLRWLNDAEEQVESSSDLISLLHGKYFPKGFYPQTPTMMTISWSPISAMLERGWEPVALTRTPGLKRRACASGIWTATALESAKVSYEECETPEQLFWHLMGKVVEKARTRGQLISVITKPGWCYQSNIGLPSNLTLAEAQEADRVIWQRTPRLKV